MRAGAPGSRVEGLPGKFKDDATAARYFRKVKSGERTGGTMYRAGSQDKPGRSVGLFQVKLQLGKDRYISQNVTVAGASSSFDIYSVEQEMKKAHRQDLTNIIEWYRGKYGMEKQEVDEDAILDDLEARAIRHQRRPSRFWMGIR